MIFFKYIISIIYNGCYKRAIRQSVYPDDSVKFRFGLRSSFWICLMVFLTSRILIKFLDFNINITANSFLILSMTFILLFGILLSLILNFEWIKNIELNQKQKNNSRIILFFLIGIIGVLYWI